jgi:hypothetical protein
MRILYHTLVEDLKVRDYLGNVDVDRIMRFKLPTEANTHIWAYGMSSASTDGIVPSGTP